MVEITMTIGEQEVEVKSLEWEYQGENKEDDEEDT